MKVQGRSFEHERAEHQDDEEPRRQEQDRLAPIAILACAAGILARGGALGVGNATRAAVRDSIILVIILNYIITWMFYQL